MGTPSGQWCEDWPIAGRDEELKVLRRAINAARVGRGSIVVLEGPRGSGRTRLVQEAAVQARHLDFRVVWLPARVDVASAVVAAVMDDAARGRPVVLIDDEEPAPGFPSIGIDVSRLPAVVLLTRTVASLGADDRVGEAGLQWNVTRLRIPPLRPGAVMALAAHMGIGASMATLQRLHVATAGNALLVVETLRALGHADPLAEPEPWPLSERASRWVCTGLDALPAAGRAAMEAASVLGVECDVSLVAQLLGLAGDPSDVGTALEASAFVVLRKDGDRCRFVAPLARELVYASLPAERRAASHARAAVVLGANGTSRDVLAHHALAAAAVGDARRCEHYVTRLIHEPAARNAPMSPSDWPHFVREGEHWAIGFGDRAIRLHDRTGLYYLAHLLSRPGVEFSALALGKRSTGENGSGTGLGQPPLATERARVRVTRRIRDGIERIARVHPELGAHLERTIRTGARCVYVVDPANAPRWEVRWST